MKSATADVIQDSKINKIKEPSDFVSPAMKVNSRKKDEKGAGLLSKASRWIKKKLFWSEN